MGYINLEIPDNMHGNIRTESEINNVPIKMVIIESLRRDFDENGSAATFSTDD
jgi:hypothetical protein